MSNESSSGGSAGIGIGGLVFVILLIGKIVGFVHLSWFVVLTSIIWAPVIGFLVVLAFLAIGAGIVVGGAAGVSAISDAHNKSVRNRLLKDRANEAKKNLGKD